MSTESVTTTHHLKSHVAGDTFRGMPVTFWQDTDGTIPYSLIGATIRMDFRRKGSGRLVLQTFVGGGITVTDAAAGTIYIGGFALDMDAGTYEWDLVVWSAAGAKMAVIRGEIKILKSFTQ